MSGFSLFWCRFVPRSQGGLQSSVHRGTRERCGVLLPTWAGSGLQQQDVWGGGLLQPPPEVQPGLWAVQDHGQVLLLPRLESGPGRRQLPQHRWGDGAPCLYWQLCSWCKDWSGSSSIVESLAESVQCFIKKVFSFREEKRKFLWVLTSVSLGNHRKSNTTSECCYILIYVWRKKNPIHIYSNDPAVEWCEDLLSVYLQPITFHYSRVVSVKASSPNTGPKSLI